MFTHAIKDLPKTEHYRFIFNKQNKRLFEKALRGNLLKNDYSVKILNKHTDGQASTCEIGSNDLNKDSSATISACDNGMIYESKNFTKLINDPKCDIIIWGARGYPGAIKSPKMYGWIDYDKKTHEVIKISVKKELNNPKNDLIVVGTFTFKKLGHMFSSINRMKKRKALINDEYYLDMAINDSIKLGYKCKVLEIQNYVCWGTPNDLATFNYWQSCFKKWQSHPYKI